MEPLRLWVVTEDPVRNTSQLHIALQAKEELDQSNQLLLQWHWRLGHVDMKRVWELGRAGDLGAGKWSDKFSRVECIGCLQGKTTRQNSLSNADRAAKPLISISIDLWGPATTRTRLGDSYFLTCYDDYSGYVHATPLRSKDQACNALIAYINLAENQLNQTVKTIRSDQGGEFKSHKLRDWCVDKGIDHDFTPTDAHNQNSRVERVHLTIMNDVRTALVDSGLGKTHWGDALQHVVYTRNRIPNTKGKVPYLLFKADHQHTSIDYGHFQAFGSPCIYQVHRQESKLDPRGCRGRMIGYGAGTTSYTILTDQREVIVSQDVVFLSPQQQPQGENHHDRTVQQDGRVEQVIVDEDEEEAEVVEKDFEDEQPEAPVVEQPEVRGWRYVEFEREAAPSPELDNRRVQVDRGQGEVQTSSRLRGEPPEIEVPLAGAPQALATILHHAYSAQTVTNPQTYQEARQSAEWKHWDEAMGEEMEKMERYEVWQLVPRENQRTLSGKWVYTRKIDGETGKAAAYKARFVVKGFMQVAGRDYDELFAAVAHKPSLRVFLSIVNYMDWECDQMDVIGAFLKGSIDRDLHIEPPPGSNIPAGFVLHLQKSLYGLKQSPHLFNKKIDSFLQSLDFTPCTANPCIYNYNKGGDRFMISIHVDDLLIAGNNRAKLDDIKAKLHAELECKDQGPVAYSLGINVHRDRPNRKMYLSQERYLEALLGKFGEVGNPCKTILPTDWKPWAVTDAEVQEASDKPYPALAGSNLYAATVTRPDIAFAASLLC
jgi:hypothetical protein